MIGPVQYAILAVTVLALLAWDDDGDDGREND
jgi:hypothetical protein